MLFNFKEIEMSILSNFILKNDRSIIKAILFIIPSLIVILGLLPPLIENYTFNAMLHGERDNYLDFFQAFRCIQIFAFAFILITLFYNILRRWAVKDIVNTTGPYFTGSSTFMSFLVAAVIALVCFFVNVNYENKNVSFITAKLVDIKKYIQDGKCEAARPYSPSVENDPNWGNISDCSTISTNLPGILYFRLAGSYASHKIESDGTINQVTQNEPNTITYKGYFSPFCRSLEDKDHILHIEFSNVKVHGMSPLADDFKTSSCEQYKGIGQIQLSFK